MKTEMENNKNMNMKKIWKFTLFLWLITYKRVAGIFYVSFYIPKFKGSNWLWPCNIHLLSIYSEAHFFLSDFIWHIYSGYVQTTVYSCNCMNLLSEQIIHTKLYTAYPFYI